MPVKQKSKQVMHNKLRPYDVTAVCGPMVGGAFLSLLTARARNAFLLYESDAGFSAGLFQMEYVLPPDVQSRIREERIGIPVDLMNARCAARTSRWSNPSGVEDEG
jgi:hypothetical protein